MKKAVKTILMLLTMGLTSVSCTKSSLSEDQKTYYIQATEGDDGEVEEHRGH